jgi:hypothetical protein
MEALEQYLQLLLLQPSFCCAFVLRNRIRFGSFSFAFQRIRELADWDWAIHRDAGASRNKLLLTAADECGRLPPA